jgi:hypothetical protein
VGLSPHRRACAQGGPKAGKLLPPQGCRLADLLRRHGLPLCSRPHGINGSPIAGAHVEYSTLWHRNIRTPNILQIGILVAWFVESLRNAASTCGLYQEVNVKSSRSARPTVTPSLRRVKLTVTTWAVTLAVLISASILASSFGLMDAAPEISAQRSMVVASHAAGTPEAPSSAPAKAANATPQ